MYEHYIIYAQKLTALCSSKLDYQVQAKDDEDD